MLILLLTLKINIMSKEKEIPLNEKERIDASVLSKDSKIYAAKRLSNFFEIDLTLKIFGVVVFSWHFPPRSKYEV